MQHVVRVIATGALALLSVLPGFAIETSQMVGRWEGQGQSIADGRSIVPCVNVLSPGDNNRFQASVLLSVKENGEIIPCVFPADLVLSKEGVITGGGIHEGHRLLIHGKVREMGDGSLRLAAFSYKLFQWHGGLLEEGHMVLFQMIGGANWNNLGDGINATDISAFQHGSYFPEGAERLGDALEAELVNEGPIGGTARLPTTMIGGAIRFNNPPEPVLPALDFDVAGTVGPAVESGRAAFGVIGLNNPPDPVQPSGIIAILIGEANPPDPVLPARLEGEYRLYDSFAAVYTDVFHGTDSSFSQGTFALPAVQ